MGEPIPQSSKRYFEPLDAELFDAVKAFVLEARDRYVEYQKTGKYMSKVHDLPKYGEFETGFPHISKAFSSDVLDFKGALNVEAGEFAQIAYGDWESALDVAGKQISSITLATSLLREVVRQLVKRPDLSTPSDIDSKLLLRSLARRQQLDDKANADQTG